MIFKPLPLKGAYTVEREKLEDDRGYFTRIWCRREFLAQGLDAELAQNSISFNKKRGTVRGVHYQVPPAAESKLICCTRGRLFDVALDLRPWSATFLRWSGVELTPDNNTMIFIPKGFAHGFQTLADETEILYQISEFYSPGDARGLRWNDPLFAIRWPEPVTEISERDRTYPDASRDQFVELEGVKESK